ncbi:MOSC domain-containing protein [Rhizobium etli bv. phaseoli str. IE4803]|nr:MOSC domain-containing protein [Rhizobium etli bv. phaseoli str. IE4803]
MTADAWELRGLLIGKVAPLGARASPSGIAKSPVKGPVWLRETGFERDAQGDTRRHGGVEKAVHHYPLDHYDDWRAELGGLSLLDGPGAFGENVSTNGLRESDVAIGDVFRTGSAIIQVSQGRQPCWKLNERFARPTMARDVQRTGRTGWYYRVLEPGTVSPDDSLVRVERPTPEWTIERIWRAFYIDTMKGSELSGIANLTTLAQGWRDHAARRLETGRIEDWRSRLEGRGDLA